MVPRVAGGRRRRSRQARRRARAREEEGAHGGRDRDRRGDLGGNPRVGRQAQVPACRGAPARRRLKDAARGRRDRTYQGRRRCSSKTHAGGTMAIGFMRVLAASLVIASVTLAHAQTQGTASAVPAAETGIASVYSSALEGQLTASGQRYDGNRMTAAHRTLPFGTRIRVTDPATGRTVTVRVNDRWGGGPGRVVNLSRRAAEDLGLGSFGQLTVRIDVEKLGDGQIESPSEDEAVPREALAPRVESTGNDPAGRTLRCENEADILGLRDQWRVTHVRACLARKPARP